MTEEKSGYELFVGCLGTLVLIGGGLVVGWLWDGYVIMRLWNWFIPALLKAPVITIWWGLALSAFWGPFMPYVPPKDDSGDELSTKIVRTISIIFLRPAFFLFVGWLVHTHVTPV